MFCSSEQFVDKQETTCWAKSSISCFLCFLLTYIIFCLIIAFSPGNGKVSYVYEYHRAITYNSENFVNSKLACVDFLLFKQLSSHFLHSLGKWGRKAVL